MSSENESPPERREGIRVMIRVRRQDQQGQPTSVRILGRDSMSPAAAAVDATLQPATGSSASMTLNEVAHFAGGEGATPANFNKHQRFTFDSCFPHYASQRDVYKAVGVDVVKHVLEGFNGCVLTYGQTASGKTYSMLGPDGGSPQVLAQLLTGSGEGKSTSMQGAESSESQAGLVPRILAALFSTLSRRPSSELSWVMEMSAIELYNETFYDLLRGGVGASEPSSLSTNATSGSFSDAGVGAAFASSPITASAPSASEIRIREDRNPGGKGIFVEGATMVAVKSPADVLELLTRAVSSKHTSSTNMNATSSRSHTIITLFLEQVDHVKHDNKTTSRLFLVDLAGSERVEKTGAAGDRLREAQTINLSLTLLGNVIKKLTDGKSLHIPYRDSKLTRLLQDSLGGNSMTTLLCTVSPDVVHSNETLSTLMFAQRAKSIKNRPIANKVMTAEEMSRELMMLRREVLELREKLRDFTGLVAPSRGGDDERKGKLDDDGELKATLTSVVAELHQVKEELRDSSAERDELRERLAFHSQSEEDMRRKAAEWEEKFSTEKAACDAAMRKLQELLGGKAGGAVVSSPIPPQAKSTPKIISQQPLSSAKRQLPQQTTSFRRFPNAGAQQPSLSLPNDKLDEAPVTVVAMATESLSVATDEEVRAAREKAEQREAQSLVRERMLLTQVDTLTAELAKYRKFSVMCDQLLREIDMVKGEANKRLEDQEKMMEGKLKVHDATVAEMQALVDKQRAELEEAVKQRSAAVDSDEVAHLRMENKELHSENRANAVRLLDFTKRIDSLSKEVNGLKDDRAKLSKALEEANMDAQLKKRLLELSSLKGQVDKSYFRKKFLECIATE